MKVRMKQLVTGMTNGVRYPPPGETVVVTDTCGADLCAKGLAEPVAEKPAERTEKRSKGAGKSPCPVDGCDYAGSERGLKIHTGQVHGEDD